MLTIKLIRKYNTHIFGSIGVVIILSFGTYFGLLRFFSIEKPTSILLLQEDFLQMQGYKLGYDLYLPNSFTGWEPNDSNKFTYDAARQLYEFKGLNISQSPIDTMGARFKITAFNWQNELGLTFTDATNERSTFGITNNGVVLNLKYYVDSRDMYFELPAEAQNNSLVLNVQVKVISQEYHPRALMYVEYKSPTAF